MRKYLSFILLLIGLTLQAQETYKTVKDISYIPAGETDGYRKERCKLDVYYPVGKKGFPTIVWFHGGGLEIRKIGGRRKACSRDVYESGICSRRCQLPPES